MRRYGLKGNRIPEKVQDAYLQQEMLIGHGGSIVFFAKLSYAIKVPDFVKKGEPFSLVLTPENVIKLTGRERILALKAINLDPEPSTAKVSPILKRLQVAFEPVGLGETRDTSS